MEKNDNNWGMVYARAFVHFFFTLGVASVIIFFGVRSIHSDIPYKSVFKLIGFKVYNFTGVDSEPTFYLLSIVVMSTFVAATWITFFAYKYSRHIKIQILLIPWISLILTSPIFGLLYSIYLRKPTDFIIQYPSNSREVMWLFYKTDALDGLKLGWLAAIQSFPINILSYLAFCSILFIGYRIFSQLGNADEKEIAKG